MRRTAALSLTATTVAAAGLLLPTAASASTSQPAGHSVTAVVANCTTTAVRPHRLTVDCRHHRVVTGLRWSRWTAGQALGAGLLRSHGHAYPVSVRLGAARQGVFRSVAVGYLHGRPARAPVLGMPTSLPAPTSRPTGAGGGIAATEAPEQLAADGGDGASPQADPFTTGGTSVTVAFTQDCSGIDPADGDTPDLTIDMYDADDDDLGRVASATGDVAGQTVTYALPAAGDYYLDVETDCSWTTEVDGLP